METFLLGRGLAEEAVGLMKKNGVEGEGLREMAFQPEAIKDLQLLFGHRMKLIAILKGISRSFTPSLTQGC